MAYFECMVGSAGGGATITVTYNSSFYNKTMICSNGTKTYTKTTTSSGSTEFKVSDEGTWTITCNGVSRTVLVTLNYSTQMSVTKTITVYGAVGATISYTDATGSKTATLDNTGKKTNVSITFIPPSQTITFTDTNKAKNPSNLSQNYSKSIAITENTTSIKVMPDNALYWYGWKDACEEMSTANGWSSNYGFTSVTFNTSYVALNNTVNKYCGIGSKTKITGTKTIRVITQNITKNTSDGNAAIGAFSAKTSLGGSSWVGYKVMTGTALQSDSYQLAMPSGGYIVVNAWGSSMNVYALWYE